MRKAEEINREIETLRNDLETLEGTATEVYTRIVGYYRSVRNWNKGKREEYKYRVPFGLPAEKTVETVFPEVQKELFSSDNREAEQSGAVSYRYFYRDTCPNCPPVSAALEELAMPGEKISVDDPEGMEEAVRRGILSSPTVVFLNPRGDEVSRTGNAGGVRAFLDCPVPAESRETAEVPV